MSSWLKSIAGLIVILGVIHLLALWIGVWLPDVFWSTPRTLAAARLSSGDELRVVQYWNHFDFYTTELRHTAPNGRQETRVLDGDDCKSWRIPMSVDAQNRTASVTLCGGREKTIAW